MFNCHTGITAPAGDIRFFGLCLSQPGFDIRRIRAKE